MAAPYPSIDAGYINDPRKKLDCIMSDFFEAEYSQSYLFCNSITSFPWILQNYQSDPDEMINQLRLRLRPYVLRYFDDIELECAIEDNLTTTDYGIRLYVQVKQEGEEPVTLYNRLKIKDDKFQRSIAIRE